MKRENIQNVYKLTPMQAGMLFHWMLDRSSDVYCEQYLDNYTIQATLPKLNVLPENYVYDHEEYNFEIDELLSRRLEEIAKEKHVSLNMLCQAIWGILLQKYNNTNDVVFGSVVSGRPPGTKNIEKMIGLFINTIPVRIKTADLANFSLLIMQLQQNTVLAIRYEYLPLSEVQATSQLKRDLIDHVMVFENYPIREKVLEINKETDLEFDIDDLSHIGRTNYDFNDTTAEYPKDKVIHQLFAEQAARTPDNIAVVGPVQVKYRTHMTYMTYISYRELNQKAHQLAYVLKERGVLSDTIVGIMVERSLAMIIGILGILKAGAAYLFAFDRVFAITETDILIQQASYSFDVFVEEVYSPLYRGGKLVIPTKEEVMDIHLLSDVIAAHGATIISCTPLMLNVLNELSQIKKIKTPRLLISGGDTLKPGYIENLMKIGTVYNTYGSTETTVCATYYQCVKDIASHVPIGKPIANYRVYILDHNRGLLPIGVAGELCIYGAGVSRGYLNRPELTAEKFRRAVISHSSLVTGSSSKTSYSSSDLFPNDQCLMTNDRLYLTGDLARWLPDGNIEFLGRSDHQVKIRGYRIELEEIETQILANENVKETIVIARETKVAAETYLCAYMVLKKEIDISQLKNKLLTHLPDYMIPSYFTFIEKIPLTPIHDGTGQVEGYIEFSHRLTIGLNCWGIRAPGLENNAPRSVSILEIARQYIKTMKRIQPRGPYFIAGWSLGGTIAFEMACQLEQEGEQLARLIPGYHFSIFKISRVDQTTKVFAEVLAKLI